ncbi:uncharacterized protein BYT42DRAFT_161273 [Radiomyces spectabilis]|uniref:uncharacterized protein n=1 Tax=Radiomyces spectabilis TaxID=64574 RepID=UPI0022204A8A|nr:uncharacterized protein BYT42DRAFT_161273 [Radiomyces spectabilis]KAI8365358.1 hypothetical protein BYT42DRAFT_161273 [Radiomyces spectabilis]
MGAPSNGLGFFSSRTAIFGVGLTFTLVLFTILTRLFYSKCFYKRSLIVVTTFFFFGLITHRGNHQLPRILPDVKVC